MIRIARIALGVIGIVTLLIVGVTTKEVMFISQKVKMVDTEITKIERHNSGYALYTPDGVFNTDGYGYDVSENQKCAIWYTTRWGANYVEVIKNKALSTDAPSTEITIYNNDDGQVNIKLDKP